MIFLAWIVCFLAVAALVAQNRDIKKGIDKKGYTFRNIMFWVATTYIFYYYFGM